MSPLASDPSVIVTPPSTLLDAVNVLFVNVDVLLMVGTATPPDVMFPTADRSPLPAMVNIVVSAAPLLTS